MPLRELISEEYQLEPLFRELGPVAFERDDEDCVLAECPDDEPLV